MIDELVALASDIQIEKDRLNRLERRVMEAIAGSRETADEPPPPVEMCAIGRCADDEPPSRPL